MAELNNCTETVQLVELKTFTLWPFTENTGSSIIYNKDVGWGGEYSSNLSSSHGDLKRDEVTEACLEEDLPPHARKKLSPI